MGENLDEKLTADKTPTYMLAPSLKFKLSLPEFREDSSMVLNFLEIIKSNNMSRYYKQACRDLHWKFDYDFYESMQNINTKIWNNFESPPGDWSPEIDETIEKLQKILNHSSQTGEIKKGTEMAFSIINNSTFVEIFRVEAAFSLFRLGFLDLDISLMIEAIQIIKDIIESDCSTTNWHYKNKLKAYEAVCRISKKDFKGSADLLLDCISTYESYELMPFKKILEYMTIAGTLSWTREEIKKNMIENGVFIQSLILEDPELQNYFNALYECNYAKLLQNLDMICQRIRHDPLIHSHRKFYIREMKIRAYSQILQAYRSLTLKGISEEFQIPISIVEEDLVKFIRSHRIHCKIDNISQCVISMCSSLSSSLANQQQTSETSCERQKIYKNIIKSGDSLLYKLRMLLTIVDV